MTKERTRDIQSRLQPPYRPKKILSRSRFKNRGSSRFASLVAILFLGLCLIPLTAHAREAKENARIEHLISSVEKLTGAKFIRNGTEYDPAKAGSHLRIGRLPNRALKA